MNKERRARLQQAVELFNHGTEILEDELSIEETFDYAVYSLTYQPKSV